MGLLNFLLKSAAIDAAKEVALTAIDVAGKTADNKILTSKKSPDVIKIPHSSSDYGGKNYLDVQNELIAFGFTNVACLPIKDLVKGWLTKDGSVERISINGKSEFKAKAKVNSDARITIEYHTFKEKYKPVQVAPVNQPTSSASIAFCPNCGRKLDTVGNFCPGCGEKLK